VLKTESERPFFAVSRKVLSENGHFSGVLSFDKPPKNGIVRFQSRVIGGMPVDFRVDPPQDCAPQSAI
jgi:hypothetical protein